MLSTSVSIAITIDWFQEVIRRVVEVGVAAQDMKPLSVDIPARRVQPRGAAFA